MKSHEFASLLCSRLCHDLLSPVGALNNGIELLADEHDPEMRARCLDLLGESARASANKLKFFRLDFGAEKHDSGLDIVVRAEGPRIVLDPELAKVLRGEIEEQEIAPRAAAAWL